MYEGSQGLDETIQGYGFTSYDAWEGYMNSSNYIFETLNKPNLDLNDYENMFADKVATKYKSASGMEQE